ALAEARARLVQNHEEAAAGRSQSETTLADLPLAGTLEARLEECRSSVSQDRAALAAIKAEVEGIEREKNARAQRLTAIATERTAWTEREQRANAHLGEIEQRLNETRAERAKLDEAPAAFEAQRQELM